MCFCITESVDKQLEWEKQIFAMCSIASWPCGETSYETDPVNHTSASTFMVVNVFDDRSDWVVNSLV